MVTTETKTQQRLPLSTEPICSRLVSLAVIWLEWIIIPRMEKVLNIPCSRRAAKILPSLDSERRSRNCCYTANSNRREQQQHWCSCSLSLSPPLALPLSLSLCVCLPWGWTMNVNTLCVLICPLGMHGMLWKWSELILSSWRLDSLRWLGANNRQGPGVLAQGVQRWFHQALLDSPIRRCTFYPPTPTPSYLLNRRYEFAWCFFYLPFLLYHPPGSSWGRRRGLGCSSLMCKPPSSTHSSRDYRIHLGCVSVK